MLDHEIASIIRAAKSDADRVPYHCQNPHCGHVTYAPACAQAIICGECRGLESPPTRIDADAAEPAKPRRGISRPDLLALILGALAALMAVLS